MLSEASEVFAVTEVEPCYLMLAVQSELSTSGTQGRAWLCCDLLGDFFVVGIGLVH